MFIPILLSLSLIIKAIPIQLVRPTRDHARLEAVSEGLHALRRIPPPIAIISAVGAVHSGKSFLLNRLLDVDTTGFSVGYSIRPETNGIWMDEAREKEDDVTLLFLDTEGFFSPNVTNTYDAKMFAIATLLSSEVIYNTVKFIDNQQVELLELLIRRTNLFGLRAYARHTYQGQKQSQTSESQVQTPSPVSNLSAYLRVLVPSRLSWVVQDFVQDLGGLQPEDWLRALITRDRNTTASVGTFFNQIDCVPLPVPAGDSETLQKLDQVHPKDLDRHYMRELNAFRQRLFRRARLHPKVKGGSKVVEGGDLAIAPMSGADLADLLEFLVDAANIGTMDDSRPEQEPFPQLPSIAEQFTSLQLRLMKSDILNILEKDLAAIINQAYRDGMPLKRSLYTQEVSKAEHQAIALWNSTVKGLVSSKDLLTEVSAAEQDFSEGLVIVRSKTATKNCDLVAIWCHDFTAALLEDLEKSIDAETVSAWVPNQLETFLVEQIDPVRHKFLKVVARDEREWVFDSSGSCCRVSSDDFDADLKNITGRVKHRNIKLIEEEFESVIESLLRSFKARLAKKKEEDDFARRSKAAVDRYFELERTSLMKDFEESLYKYRTISIMNIKRQLFTRAIDNVVTAFHKEWSQRCQEEAEQFLKSASMRYPFNIRRSVSLPAEEDVLLSIIQNHSDDLVRSFQQVVFCHDSPYGLLYTRRLNDLLTQTKESLISQNVQTLKEISGQPLRDLEAELRDEASHYYIFQKFNNMAKRRAVDTLQNAIAQYESEGLHQKAASTTSMSLSMIHKVAQSFVDEDLQDARTLIYSNLTMLLLILLSLTYGVYKVLRDMYESRWWEGIKWSLFLVFISGIISTPSARAVCRQLTYKFSLLFQKVLPVGMVLTLLALAAGVVVLWSFTGKSNDTDFPIRDPPPATHAHTPYGHSARCAHSTPDPAWGTTTRRRTEFYPESTTTRTTRHRFT